MELGWLVPVEHDLNISLLLLYFFSDVDECTTAAHKCHANADCVNTQGLYNCTCKPGYTGDGHNCTGEIYNDHKSNNVQIIITSQGLFGGTAFNASPVTYYQLYFYLESLL